MNIENINIRNIINMAVSNNAIIIDVREANQFYEGHIPMAINIPLEEIEKGYCRLPREKLLIFYCESGASSLMAARILAKKGYRVVNAVGGLREYNKDLTQNRES